MHEQIAMGRDDAETESKADAAEQALDVAREELRDAEGET
jgi:hypothetical protein